jgi:hypothetical protein
MKEKYLPKQEERDERTWALLLESFLRLGD